VPNVKLALVGAGNIAQHYANTLARYPETTLVGVTDVDAAKARDLATHHGVTHYPTLEALLDDVRVELVVNLTTHRVHFELTKQCLTARRHVYSEKPLALKPREAHTLVALAQRQGVRLACSPFTFLNEAQQTLLKQVRDQRVGKLRVAYAEMNWGRIETWHPEPYSFYEVGPLWDVGVYPLTLLTALFGPAHSVTASASVVLPQRTTLGGSSFEIMTPNFIVALITFADDVSARLSANFYVPIKSNQVGLELHGDDGSLFLSDWLQPDAAVMVSDYDKPYTPLPLVRDPADALEWGLGVREFAQSILDNRPSRLNAEHAAHVVDVLNAIDRAANTGARVDISSQFPLPAAMEWAA